MFLLSTLSYSITSTFFLMRRIPNPPISRSSELNVVSGVDCSRGLKYLPSSINFIIISNWWFEIMSTKNSTIPLSLYA